MTTAEELRRMAVRWHNPSDDDFNRTQSAATELESLTDERDALKARVAELEKDKQRLEKMIGWHSFHDSKLPTRDWTDNQDARIAIDEMNEDK